MGLFVSFTSNMGWLGGGLTNVRVTILPFDSNLNTILLCYLFRTTERPVEAILALLLGHSLSSRPFGTVVIPSETALSLLFGRCGLAYKSEDPLIRAHSSSVKVGILSPNSFEMDSGK
jgi:hypothetical protein